MNVPVILLPAEVQHPTEAQGWVLATIRRNATLWLSADHYGGTEVGILDDQVWFTRYLIALARLTLEGRRIVNAARGEHQEIGS